MAESKQAQPYLNGAYYGPSIPPPTNYHRHGRGRGCGCGPCCLLGFLLKLIVSVVIIIGIAVLVFWFVARPREVKFHVVNASLNEFNFTNNQLQYNLALNMTIRNPNKKIGLYYDQIEARALYKGEQFDSIFMTPFYQGHKNTTMLNPVFQGKSPILLGGSEVLQYNKEKNNGAFEVEVKLYLRIRFKLGAAKSRRVKPKIECDLKIPLAANGKSTGAFGAKKCKVDF